MYVESGDVQIIRSILEGNKALGGIGAFGVSSNDPIETNGEDGENPRHRCVILEAATAAPNPLSMFTTVMPDAQLVRVQPRRHGLPFARRNASSRDASSSTSRRHTRGSGPKGFNRTRRWSNDHVPATKPSTRNVADTSPPWITVARCSSGRTTW